MESLHAVLCRCREALYDHRRALMVMVVGVGLLAAAVRYGIRCNCMADTVTMLSHQQLLVGMRFFNIMAFMALIVVTQRFGERLLDRRTGNAAAGLLLLSQLANHAIIAWTHVPTALMFMTGMMAYHRFTQEGGAGPLAVAAACGGLVFTLRYPAVVLFVPVAGHFLVRTIRSRELPVRPVLVATVALFVVVVPSLAFHQYAFGDVTETPYHARDDALPPNQRQGIATDFDPRRLPRNAWRMLVDFDPDLQRLDPQIPDFRYSERKAAVLQVTPLFLLAVVGFPVLWRRWRGVSAMFLAQFLLLLGVYGSWVYFSGGFGSNMRYLAAVVPVFALWTAAGLRTVTVPDRFLLASGLSGLVLTPLVLHLIVTGTTAGSLAGLRELGLAATALTGISYLLYRRDERAKGLFWAAGAIAAAVSIVSVHIFQNLGLYTKAAFLTYPTSNLVVLGLWVLGAGLFCSYAWFDGIRGR